MLPDRGGAADGQLALGPVAWTTLAALAGWELAPAAAGPLPCAACVCAAPAGGATVLVLGVVPVPVAVWAWALALAPRLLPARLLRDTGAGVALALLQVGPCAAILVRLGWVRPAPALLCLLLPIPFTDAFACFVGWRVGRLRPFPATSPNKDPENIKYRH